MNSFVDETYITVLSGRGGDGAVSFRREKYIPRGGPDGGDGGDGGNVVFLVKKNLKTLYHLKLKKVFKAENGKPGGKKKMHGRNGRDVEIYVPPGTVVRDATSNRILHEFVSPEDRWICLHGGRGGRGNVHFANPVRQAPKFAEPGREGKEKRLKVELKLIADIGIVGLPNAGKSTLLSVLTNAEPEIASYPFTTKIPNLGVMKVDDTSVILADIPGIIEGASSGTGLGLRFLKHIERTHLLLFLIDLSREDFLEQTRIIENELKTYSAALANKGRKIVGSKIDMPEARERLEKLRAEYGKEIFGISAVTHEGMEMLKINILKDLYQFTDR